MDKADLTRRMDGALETLKKEYAGLRAGRASTSMLDPVVVEVYGSKMPLAQVATVGVPEPRLLTVQVWDMSNTKAVEKAIRESGLGLNPQAEGSLIRVPIPPINEERRKELVKVSGQYTEAAKVSIRNIRKDGMDQAKKIKDDGGSEDDSKRASDEVQKLTDEYIKKIDALAADKEKEIMTV